MTTTLRRILFEYLANPGVSDRDESALRADGVPLERRRNPHARVLVDWMKDQMAARAFPPHEAEELLNDVRAALREEAAGERFRSIEEAPSG